MFEIINTKTEKDIKDEFVAIGSYLDSNKNPNHSVLVIKYKSHFSQFHFNGEEILLDSIYGDHCFHKLTDVIDPKLIPAFIMMCKNIKQRANIKYGYFYAGEFFDKNGTHFSAKPTSKYMTCVGFCINILKGFIEEDYISFNDWDSTSHYCDDYLTSFSERTGLKENDICDSHRRISPLELLCSGFYSKTPISKKQIDLKLEETSDYLTNY